MSYPTLRAVLRRTRTAPALPATEHRLEIRLDGSTFAVVDLDGRTFGEVIAEATDPRGFGRMPRTIEGFMDATSATLHGPAPASSEFTGDLGTGYGMAVEAGGEPREVPARLLAPIAEQVLDRDTVDGREPVGEAELLGRTCAEYRFAVTGQDDGCPYRSDVRLLVWNGLVLLRDVQDAAVPGLRATAEVVELRS